MKTWAILLLLYTGTVAGKCAWDNCNPNSNDKNVLNVHLVTHSHDDLGWLITVDQYYDRGTYIYIERILPIDAERLGKEGDAEVQHIYDSVVAELEKDPSRRFSFAETGFLMRWVESRNASTVARLQKVVQNGQAELIGGGWVQNDEAASHYVDIIDHMTLGYEHLSTLFGECGAPRAAWQIDPFGHSREYASLAAQMGMTSLWFARLHYLDRSQRHTQKNIEFNWVGSDDLKTTILGGSFFNHYSPLSGFCFDTGCNDEELNDGNIDRRAREFMDKVKDQASHYRTNNVMLTMGDDFQYQSAGKWFKNLDILIKYINANPAMGLNVQYSTPACYAAALQSTGSIFQPKQDDFFPYASGDHSFWTGYFTSRPTFKGMIRQASSYLNLAKQLSANFLLDDGPALEIAKRASGLVQHHDAVTGTAKQVVTYDYAQRLDKGIRQLEVLINDALKSASGGAAPPKHVLCLLSNETICDVSKASGSYAVSIFNPVGKAMSSFVRVPFYHPVASVQDDTGTAIQVQVTAVQSIPTLSSPDAAPYELFIPVQLGPAGFKTFFVSGSGLTGRPLPPLAAVPETVTQPNQFDAAAIENEFVKLQFDTNGFLSSVLDKKTGVRRNLRQEFFYYESMGNNGQPSGAYVFRPLTQTAKSLGTVVAISAVQGPLVQEVRQKVNDFVYQTVRLYAGKPQIEFDWVIGPLPKEGSNPVGKEFITRYTSEIAGNGIFYTDSSGRQVLKRTWDSYPMFQYEDSEPVSGNYYPVTNRIFIKDTKSQMTVLTDRSQGGTSKDGAIELMLHRRCFYDDHFGVSEALDEPGKDGKGLVVRGQHWLLIGDAATQAAIHRPMAVEMFHRPIAAYATVADPAGYRSQYKTKYSGLTASLPNNVNLLTLEKRGNEVLLRLEHIFQSNEDSQLSQAATVDFGNLFTGFKIQSVQELYLGANRNLTMGVTTQVTLKPQQIRTFRLAVQPK